MPHSLILLAEQPHLPMMSSMDWIMLVSRILHILGAVILVGGLFYIRAVVSPAAAPTGPQDADRFFGGRRATWAKWVGIATALLLVTGFWNYAQFTKTYDLAKTYHMVLGIKIVAAIIVFLLAALLAGRTHAAETIRRKWSLWLDVCVVLAIVTVVIASYLRSYPHNPKAGTVEQPQLVAPANNPAG